MLKQKIHKRSLRHDTFTYTDTHNLLNMLLQIKTLSHHLPELLSASTLSKMTSSLATGKKRLSVALGTSR